MSGKSRRYALKSSEAKTILSIALERFGADISSYVGPKVVVEAVETGKGDLLLLDKRAILFKVGENVYPTLLFDEFLKKAPKITVDMGAIRHVCNGADVMAPGIVHIEGEFSKGDLVQVVDVQHGKKLALGEVQFDAEPAKTVKKGVVVKNLHFVGDEIWNAIKEVGA